ncbi:MAG: hypothetical protein Q4D81_14805 [Eubacteriales bacterium]|nr:hypothetical protein [Eubacteriales bacterium]
MKRKMRICCLCCAVIAALMLSACGGSSAGSKSDNTANAENTVTDSGKEADAVPEEKKETAEDAEAETETATESDADKEAEAETETGTEPEAETEAEAETETGTEPEAETDSVSLAEAYEVIADTQIWFYKYGEGALDTETLMMWPDGTLSVDSALNGSYTLEENEDGTVTIAAQLKANDSTLDSPFLLRKADGGYEIVPKGDYWRKADDPDNPAWDNAVFVPLE